MQSKAFRLGPLAMSNAVANILNPGTTAGGVNTTGAPYTDLRVILTHIRIVNKTNAGATYSLYIGASGLSAAGTEFMGNGKAVAANDVDDWYGRVPLDVADFLTGAASGAATLTIEAEGEIMIA